MSTQDTQAMLDEVEQLARQRGVLGPVKPGLSEDENKTGASMDSEERPVQRPKARTARTAAVVKMGLVESDMVDPNELGKRTRDGAPDPNAIAVRTTELARSAVRSRRRTTIDSISGNGDAGAGTTKPQGPATPRAQPVARAVGSDLDPTTVLVAETAVVRTEANEELRAQFEEATRRATEAERAPAPSRARRAVVGAPADDGALNEATQEIARLKEQMKLKLKQWGNDKQELLAQLKTARANRETAADKAQGAGVTANRAMETQKKFQQDTEKLREQLAALQEQLDAEKAAHKETAAEAARATASTASAKALLATATAEVAGQKTTLSTKESEIERLNSSLLLSQQQATLESSERERLAKELSQLKLTSERFATEAKNAKARLKEAEDAVAESKTAAVSQQTLLDKAQTDAIAYLAELNEAKRNRDAAAATHGIKLLDVQSQLERAQAAEAVSKQHALLTQGLRESDARTLNDELRVRTEAHATAVRERDIFKTNLDSAKQELKELTEKFERDKRELQNKFERDLELARADVTEANAKTERLKAEQTADADRLKRLHQDAIEERQKAHEQAIATEISKKSTLQRQLEAEQKLNKANAATVERLEAEKIAEKQAREAEVRTHQQALEQARALAVKDLPVQVQQMRDAAKAAAEAHAEQISKMRTDYNSVVEAERKARADLAAMENEATKRLRDAELASDQASSKVKADLNARVAELERKLTAEQEATKAADAQLAAVTATVAPLKQKLLATEQSAAELARLKALVDGIPLLEESARKASKRATDNETAAREAKQQLAREQIAKEEAERTARAAVAELKTKTELYESEEERRKREHDTLLKTFESSLSKITNDSSSGAVTVERQLAEAMKKRLQQALDRAQASAQAAQETARARETELEAAAVETEAAQHTAYDLRLQLERKERELASSEAAYKRALVLQEEMMAETQRQIAAVAAAGGDERDDQANENSKLRLLLLECHSARQDLEARLAAQHNTAPMEVELSPAPVTQAHHWTTEELCAVAQMRAQYNIQANQWHAQDWYKMLLCAAHAAQKSAVSQLCAKPLVPVLGDVESYGLLNAYSLKLPIDVARVSADMKFPAYLPWPAQRESVLLCIKGTSLPKHFAKKSTWPAAVVYAIDINVANGYKLTHTTVDFEEVNYQVRRPPEWVIESMESLIVWILHLHLHAFTGHDPSLDTIRDTKEACALHTQSVLGLTPAQSSDLGSVVDALVRRVGPPLKQSADHASAELVEKLQGMLGHQFSQLRAGYTTPDPLPPMATGARRVAPRPVAAPLSLEFAASSDPAPRPREPRSQLTLELGPTVTPRRLVLPLLTLGFGPNADDAEPSPNDHAPDAPRAFARSPEQRAPRPRTPFAKARHSEARAAGRDSPSSEDEDDSRDPTGSETDDSVVLSPGGDGNHPGDLSHVWRY